jgi:transcription-repair coupling factor (superfamily II helicase)
MLRAGENVSEVFELFELFKKVLKSRLLRRAANHLAAGRAAAVIKLSGVWGSSAPLAAAAVGRMRRAVVLAVTAHLDEADDAADDVEVFTGQPAQLFPAWEADPAGRGANDDIAATRLRLCNLLSQPVNLRDEPVTVIVAPVMALMQPVPSAAALAASRKSLRRGKVQDIEELVAWLVDAGFDRVEQVEQQGDFARRGGIVDIFPSGATQAVRVEFFGDQIESIRRVDLDTQRSTDAIDGYDLTAASAVPGQETNIASLLDYLPADAIVCLIEPGAVEETAQAVYSRLHDIETPISSAPPEESIEQATPMATVERWFTPQEVLSATNRFARLETYAFRPAEGQEAIDLGVRSLHMLTEKPAESLETMGELAATDDVWVYCETPAEQKRFTELLAASHPHLAGAFHTAIGHVAAGFHFPEIHLAAVGHHEIFHRYAKRRRLRQVRTGRPIDSLLDLHEGDYVVHVAHGIARFQGLKRLEQGGRSEEYLTLRFADNAVLHVPASSIHLVQKYIGSRKFRPTLSKLGGVGWSRQKQRVSLAVRDLAADMLRLQAHRAAAPGISYLADSDLQREFAEEFIYVETDDQITAMDQIAADMAAAQPMDRLLCGDVGYGKTELAMRAAFKAVEAGKQVVVLVPTTVLADQHHRTFRERMADYPVTVEMLSRFRTDAEQADVIRRLVAGQVDVVIGTHRLLSGDVRFADLGLVVIDEEQRFGVAHKEHLKALRAEVDVLTMTATPIPRTLHMALLGLRDISALATAPMDRRAIYTEVCPPDDRLIRQAILRELNRQGQVFFVHNRVMDILPLADHVAHLVPEARVAVAHGQMAEGTLERTMLAFVRGEHDVLVCTTIIESGLDIPAANTILIHDADRFGLAELHQLRGRVGRSKHRAYCYLLLPQTRTISPEAAKRLKAVEQFSDLGAGFQIAMRDLELRGAGNILGPQQSGHIAAVGYELYCQLLEQAVAEVRGQPAPPQRQTHLELGIDAYIPADYVPSDRQRMEIYRRLARCTLGQDVAQLRGDLADAYGPVPAAVDTLLEQAEIRVLAGRLGIESIIRMDGDVVFAVRSHRSLKGLLEGCQGSVRLPDERTIHWRPPPSTLEPPTLLAVLLKRLRQAAGDV